VHDTYKTIKNLSEGFFKDRGSKFHSYAYPVQSEEDIKEILTSIKKEHHSARHHCFSWRLGKEEIYHRTNDDGEPSSTAGKPILRQLEKYKITNVLLVVVRYFGGTLLGTAGLINAYRSAAADALEKAEIITGTIDTAYTLSFPYNKMNDVMRIIDKENLNIISTQYIEDCRLKFSVRKSKASHIEKIFNQFEDIDIKNC
jgi:uncharacterized YigZ family protein